MDIEPLYGETYLPRKFKVCLLCHSAHLVRISVAYLPLSLSFSLGCHRCSAEQRRRRVCTLPGWPSLVSLAFPFMYLFACVQGYIAVVENNKLVGWNVTIGGGMGMTHGNKKTYPRLADLLGFCTPEQAILVGEKVMIVQRDHGERLNRKHARLKLVPAVVQQKKKKKKKKKKK